MSVKVDMSIDLADGVMEVFYDSADAPFGLSIRLSTHDNACEIKQLDINRFGEMLVKLKRVYTLAINEEKIEVDNE